MEFRTFNISKDAEEITKIKTEAFKKFVSDANSNLINEKDKRNRF